MNSKLKTLAIAATFAALSSGAAFAEGGCVPGYAPYQGVCQPIGVHNYSNPVSGAVTGEANGAARGYAAGGPIGAVVGGALGTASGTLTGTANALQGR
ncbi:MAG: hypothetical protein JO001_12785 [Alphaproteobacteria bacterium]|nr:hypothetical protein [Alphaproteobacteria bacterium]